MRRGVDRTERLDWHDLFNKCLQRVVEFQRAFDLAKNARGLDRLFGMEPLHWRGGLHQ